jgi:hypothetical protein
MKFGPISNYKGRRRHGRHGSGGHAHGQQKAGSNKGNLPSAPRPSRVRYFAERRWVANKAARIRRAMKAISTPEERARRAARAACNRPKEGK